MTAPSIANSTLSQAIFGVHAEALSLRQERMQTIASNLANADTPHYQARDIDFSIALRAATQDVPSGGMQRTAAAHMNSLPELARQHQVYRTSTQPSLDGNTVDANTEHAAFARAALEYRASLGFVESRIHTLLTAITGE